MTRSPRRALTTPSAFASAFAIAGALTTTLVVAPGRARACGQTTHQWITLHAVEHLPAGELRELLERPGLRTMLLNGTMFPDGGYPINDPYGEIAHWEPFQMAYLERIGADFDAVDAGEGARHSAFMFGMTSHGMSDQLFDSMYMFRTKVYDGEADNLDEASDVVFASLTGPAEIPDHWIPEDPFVDLYLQVEDYMVDPGAMSQGQGLLRLALHFVGEGSMVPDNLAMYEAMYPWGNAHLLDESVPGSPPCQGEVIARYWRVLWPLLQGQAFDGPPVLATFPADGTALHETAADSVESMISIVFSRALDEDALTADQFTITDQSDQPHPFTLQLFYGNYSHVVHLKPTEDLAPDEIYTVTVAPGVLSYHGDELTGHTFRFSTGAVAPEPLPDPWDDPEPGDTDTDTDSGGDTDTDGDASDASSSGGSDSGGDSGGDSGSGDASSDGAGQAPADDGCGCTTTRDGAPWWLVLLAFAWPRRRRPARGVG